mmetsp:Transcript_38686/g.122926  ORF Transcript_38686/g.122926 Transcript_38686/m.122926 type:complete len:384 (-) Transcript_38686:342-1493(-)
MCQGVKFIMDLPEDKRRMLMKVMTYQEMKTGETVFLAGSVGATFYILMSGSVGIYIPKGDSEIHVATMRSGESFGELALMSEDSIRAATIRTLFKCDFLILSKDSYDFIIKSMQDGNLGGKVDFLSELSVFEHTSRAHLQALALCMTVRAVPPKTVVIKQGNEADDLFFVRRGELRVVKAVDVDMIEGAVENGAGFGSLNPFDVADIAAKNKGAKPKASPGSDARKSRGLRASSIDMAGASGRPSRGPSMDIPAAQRLRAPSLDIAGAGSKGSKGGHGKKAFLEVNTLKKGDYFGEMGILGGGKISSSIISATSCELLVVAKFDAMKRIQESTMDAFRERIRLYSKDQDVRKKFERGIKWEMYKKNLVEDVIADRKGAGGGFR